MQLKIQRSQRAAALSGKVIFCLDARIFLTAEEQVNVNKYRLGSEVIYNSEASKKQLDAAAQAHAQGSYFKSLGRLAMVAMNLNITINSLQRGQHIECKDMNELLAGEEALNSACENLKSFLETAATFDGREVVIDYSTTGPKLVASAGLTAIPAPAANPQPPAATFTAAPPPSVSQDISPALPIQLAAGPSSAEFQSTAAEASRDTYSFPTTPPFPEFENFKRWWFAKPRGARIAIAAAVLLIPGLLFWGAPGFMFAFLLFAGYLTFELTQAGVQ